MATTQRSVRVDDETWDRAKRFADRHERTLSDLIVAFLRDLGTAGPEAEKIIRQKSRESITAHPAGSASCTHPKDQQENKGWGIICHACNRRVS